MIVTEVIIVVFSIIADGDILLVVEFISNEVVIIIIAVVIDRS